jgi:hypothetical protein
MTAQLASPASDASGGKIAAFAINRGMRTMVLLMLLAASCSSMARADPAGRQKLDFATPPGKDLPVKGASASTGNSCAAYGPGFIKVEGLNTCVKVGGAVRVDATGGTTR